uniref:PIN domain-containing protein n=1 Tax=Globodera rostochiensis TaxID=31243 RepID=A0A914H3V2_GLORO
MPTLDQQPQEGKNALLEGTSTSEMIEGQRRSLVESTRKLARSPSEKAAKRILSLSIDLAMHYADELLNNFEQSYRTNSEQELWKVCFYSSVEALRKQSGSAGPHSVVFRQYLLDLVEQAIEFYGKLLDKYEQKFGMNFSSFSRWPPNENGFPSEGLAECYVSNSEQPVHDTNVLRSAQRHIIYLGDLHRYKVQNQEGVLKDFSKARREYLRANSLEPLNGHPLNQLAVIACYEKAPVEMLFWYVRALSVRVPFESARDSIEIVLNNFRGPASNFERWVWEQKESKENGVREAQNKVLPRGPIPNGEKSGGGVRPRSKYIREVWIRPNEEAADKGCRETNANEREGVLCEVAATKGANDGIERMFVGEQAKKTQKQAVQHILNTAGILISNIGTEQFKRSSELLLMELAAFIATDTILLSPLKILEIMLVFAFPVHSAKTGASQALISEQKRTAISVILDILERFLEVICVDIDKIGLFLLTGKLSKKFSRVLPSLCFALNWLCAQQSLQPEFSSQMPSNDKFWNLFSMLCNNLEKLRENGELLECSVEHTRQHECTNAILPELVVASPFFKVYPKYPSIICFHSLPDENATDFQFLAVHARFGLLLFMGKRLATDESFAPLVSGLNGFENVPHVKNPLESTVNLAGEDVNGGSLTELAMDSLSMSSSFEHSTADESELKKKLLLDEQSSFTHHWIIEIRPKYLVPDTNTFIDHLGHIQRLVQSDKFTVLVPTIVTDELSSLAMGTPIPTGSTLLSRELLAPEGSKAAVVMQRAKSAMEWLREMANSRVGRISSATASGNVLHKLTFATDGSTEQLKKRSNDDLILSVCICLCDKLERAGNTALSSCISPGSTTLERTVVLLTEDRGLSAKAEAEKVPVRTMQSFVRWALTPEGPTKRKKGGAGEGG